MILSVANFLSASRAALINGVALLEAIIVIRFAAQFASNTMFNTSSNFCSLERTCVSVIVLETLLAGYLVFATGGRQCGTGPVFNI